MREPTVAGQFYEADRERLIAQIENCFASSLGPGKIALEKKENKFGRKRFIRAAIMPHAGYFFSGSCAAHGYKKIAESADWPDVFLILGLSHSGNKSAASVDDWKTPLGIAESDTSFTKLIIEKTDIKTNELVHKTEHSIEVQVPFIQYICMKTGRESKITPIIISHDADLSVVGKGIAAAVNEYSQQGRKVCIIASSDFTHYGCNYGYAPFSQDVKENITKLDDGAIKQIKAIQPEKFMEYIDETGATICGQMPIAALLYALQELGDVNAELLNYCQSSDILGDETNSVSYACIVFE